LQFWVAFWAGFRARSLINSLCGNTQRLGLCYGFLFRLDRTDPFCGNMQSGSVCVQESKELLSVREVRFGAEEATPSLALRNLCPFALESDVQYDVWCMWDIVTFYNMEMCLSYDLSVLRDFCILGLSYFACLRLVNIDSNLTRIPSYIVKNETYL